MNKKIVTITLLVLTVFAFTLTPIVVVFGQNAGLGVSILQVSPANNISTSGQSTYNGTVGEVMNLQGELYTSNGSFQVLFNNNVVAAGTSDQLYVNVNFTVPSLPGGTYDLTLRDVAINVNSTGSTPASFTVLTAYIISATPALVQEGGSVQLNVGVTGGQPSTPYSANVSVVLPSQLNTAYLQTLSLGTADAQGAASAQLTYPGTSFQPSNSTTDYAGIYNVYFNQSSSLASGQFTVGFLDSTTYHRGQTATIRATGYPANQAATLSITSVSGVSLITPQSLTASADGIITATQVIPSNAAIGQYTATIAISGGAQKLIPDSENFTVPGYPITIQTVNLANEAVPNILVQAVDEATNTAYNSTSDSSGTANFNFEAGSVSLTAFWNGVNVGTSNITVTGAGAFKLQCQLTDLKITVQNENGVAMPFVNLAISYQYQPASGGTQTGSASGQTSPSGTFNLNSTLTGISYTINASLYNQVFNAGNNTFNNIPAQAATNLVIICPNEPLTINVVGYTQAAIPGARIELVEITNGLFYSATTDNSGSTSLQVTFGMYRLRIYKDNILINETTVQAFAANQLQIRCTLYDIQVSVSVVDFFGSPISNANVTLNGPAGERFTAMTQGNGTATFNNVIGGDMQIVAFISGTQNNYQAVSVTINQPTSVQIKMDRYIALGSLLIQASSLIAVAVILAILVLFIVIEVYRRKRVKHAKS